MIISVEYAKRLLTRGEGDSDGFIVDDGWIWEKIQNYEHRRIDRVRVERTQVNFASEITAWPASIDTLSL